MVITPAACEPLLAAQRSSGPHIHAVYESARTGRIVTLAD
jgi:hypothetical protein